jgi:hypothetical protein
MSKKIALAITLISIMFASTFVGIPVAALDFDGSANGERQVVVPGILADELFPEYNHTYWQKSSLTVGFTQYGETVTDQDPLGAGSDYGVGLTYPSAEEGSGTEYGYVVEHIACPTISGGPSPGGLIYIPIEGWQLFWKWNEGSVGYTIDPHWHVSMAIYGNHSAPYGTRARLDVKLPEELGYETHGSKVITNTSRLFALKTHFYTYNQTLLDVLAMDPVVFEIELIYVFFKNEKKVVQFWTVQYLRSEYGAVDVVFRRLTDWSVDNKFQDFQNENFACMFPSSSNETGRDEVPGDGAGDHTFWTGCEYFPQNYSLGLAWTNQSILHWDPEDAQHHVGFIAYYPNLSNWDTDNWNWYLTNMWTQWRWNSPRAWMYTKLDPEREPGDNPGPNYAWDEDSNNSPATPDNNYGPLTVRYDGQPVTNEFFLYPTGEYAASPLMMGQWNFTLTSATALRMAKFVNVMGVTNCSKTFGYVNDMHHFGLGHYVGDWDSSSSKSGGRTISEIKYLLQQVFNPIYKLSTDNEHAQRYEANDVYSDPWGEDLDVSNWYPFAGVEWGSRTGSEPYTNNDGLYWNANNTHVLYDIGSESGLGTSMGPDADPRNTTFVYGDTLAHNGMVFTSEGAHVVDVVGGTEVGMDFGNYISDNTFSDPFFEALWDTIDFMGEGMGPFVTPTGAPDFFFAGSMETYLDPLPDYSPVGPITTDWELTALRRKSARRAPCWGGDTYTGYFTTPTGCKWDLNHIVAVGGPKVNLATEYFNEHTWAVYVSEESGTEFEELMDGGIYVFPSGNYYVGEDYSVITIVDDLNLTSWTAIADYVKYPFVGCSRYDTDDFDSPESQDGPTIVEPYAALLIWGMSGWDTRAAANWFAQNRHEFRGTNLMTDDLYRKEGVTTLILYTPEVMDSCTDWENGIKEILGPPAGRWRLSTTAWGVWIKQPLQITW